MALDERKDVKRSPDDRARAEMSPWRRDDWWSFWNEPFSSWLHHRSPDPFGFFRRQPSGIAERAVNWMPDVETFQRGDQFVVRADLPGMKKEDITLQVTDNALTIDGERRSEHAEQRESYYRSERSYGAFSRVIPLPEGALADSAKASFENGVLEVVLHAPPREVSRGRRLEIAERPGDPSRA
jgi:HSP20 family molecular chaperone IbpA